MANDSLFASPKSESSDEERLQDDDLLEDLDTLDADDREEPTLQLARDEEEGLRPNAPAYDKRFGQICLDLRDICEQLHHTVPQKHRKHDLFSHVVSQLEKAAVFPTPPKRRINVIGRSGAGKSSVLNSLMCRSGLAKANALGEGCTHVPTSYEAPFVGQTSPFALRVQCFSVDKIRKKLESMWHDYYLEHFEDEGKQDWRDEDKDQVRRAAETAFDAWRSLFVDRPEFDDEKMAKTFLERCSKKSTDKVVDILAGWCKDLLPETTDPNEDSELVGVDHRVPFLSAEAQTEIELLAKLEMYAFSDSSFQKKSLWPLVNVVRLGLDHIPILKYATLVDWPGIGDTNDLRAKASTERVSNCDEVWIVATPDRIVTDSTVWGIVHRYADSYPCAIVCTQIDLKCEESLEVLEGQSDGSSVQRLNDLAKEDKILAKKIANAEQECDRREQWDITGYRVDQAGKRRKLGPAALEQNKRIRIVRRADLQKMRARYPEVQQERRQLVVDINTRHFRQKIQDKIDRMSPRAMAPNICFVSNEHYMAHKKAKDVGGAILTLEGTGIPLLRAHILRQASPNLVANLHHYMAGEIATILAGLELYTKQEELGQCQGLMQSITKKHSSVRKFEDSYKATTSQASIDDISAPVKRSLESLVTNALAEVESHRKWHPMTLKAFVRNNGTLATRSQKAEKWNKGFAGVLGTVFSENWSNYTDKEASAFDLLKSLLVAEIEGVLDIAEGTRHSALSGRSLESLIETQVHRLEIACTRAKAAHTAKMNIIRFDATNVGCYVSTSYFDQAMQSTYEGGLAIRGKGYQKRINDFFAHSLKHKGPRSPFVKAATRTQTDIKKAAAKQARVILHDYRARITNIGDWLNSSEA